ncbi:hypothetical protein D3872_19580 [Massilia cavernae]|uniref:Uncharacterized protein n=1 Tax=Massilia cavernae TaxID=2320864 RepID=A0A418XGA9_9BURK|nr:hypothetical protein D3872_19580 [Massilia cavernae]
MNKKLAAFSPASVWGIRRQQWESPSVHEVEDVKDSAIVLLKELAMNRLVQIIYQRESRGRLMNALGLFCVAGSAILSAILLAATFWR